MLQKENNNDLSNNVTIIVKNKEGKELKISGKAIALLISDLNPDRFDHMADDFQNKKDLLAESWNFNKYSTCFQEIYRTLTALQCFALELNDVQNKA